VPRGIDDVTQLPRITYELLRAGIDEAGVRKVLGGNLLRVMRRVEEVAASLAKEPPR
jgi:membrane dipeptidase